MEEAAGALLFRMRRCRVQEARECKGMAPFPCKSVGLVEYGGFARTIDPRLETEVLVCPPLRRPQGDGGPGVGADQPRGPDVRLAVIPDGVRRQSTSGRVRRMRSVSAGEVCAP